MTIWKTLHAHSLGLRNLSTASLCKDASRNDRLTFDMAGCHFDLTQQRIDQAALDQLFQLADRANFDRLRHALFAGDKINLSEDRAVLHMALRDGAPHIDPALIADVKSVRNKLYTCAESIRSGTWRGYTNKPIRNVVHIGIGGSHLGPELVTEALHEYATTNLDIRFVANIDGYDLSRALKSLDPETTLFIVASKSFSTLETLENARSARAWFLERTCNTEAIAKHFVGITNNVSAAIEFGLSNDNLFPMWDWVGGRYSLWSAMSLPAVIAIGSENFDRLLEGAARVDSHFAASLASENLPLTWALAGIWNYNVLNCQSLAVLSYDQRLRLLPDYLQQLEMESNGKSVDRHGKPLSHSTMPILWGGCGTNGQHAYHQLLHQGTAAFAADIVMVANDNLSLSTHRNWLNANALAQAQALAEGFEPESQQEIHKTVHGKRPVSIVLLDNLGPKQLGALLAVYEHKVFCQGALWNINSFDQWGVELGKNLAGPIYESLSATGAKRSVNSSATDQLITRLQEHSKT